MVDAAPRFHLDALRWFAALTEVAGVPPSDLVVHHVGDTTSEVLDFLAGEGVALARVDPFDERSPHCNKVAGALALAERPPDGTAVLCDTDVVVLEDPRRIPVPPRSVGGKPVDAPLPPSEVLTAVFAAAGLDAPPPVMLAWGAGDRTLAGNMNGGLYLVPGGFVAELAPAWAGWARWLLDRAPLLEQWAVHVDQVAMALALAELAGTWVPLDVRWNTPTHDPSRLPRLPPVPAVLHYHEETDGLGRILPTGRPAIDVRIAAANEAVERVWNRARPAATQSRWLGHRQSARADRPAAACHLRPEDVTAVARAIAGLLGTASLVELDAPSGAVSAADVVVVQHVPAEEELDRLPLAGPWAAARRAMVVGQDLGAPGPRPPIGALVGTAEATTEEAEPEVYPLPLEGGQAALVLRPPEHRHPRDFTARSLGRLVDAHPDPLGLARIRLEAWRSVGFYPDHAPRLWEYPIVADLLQRNLPTGARLVDVGAGVTPLPPYLTALGYRVETVDPSATVRSWPPEPDWNEWDYLDYRRAGLAHRSWNRTLERLPCRRRFDAAYSISVIEHLPAESRRSLIRELASRVGDGGLVILTVDLLRGTDRLWNRSRGLVVEEPAAHGSFADLVSECHDAGLVTMEQQTVRGWGDVEVDIGLLALGKRASRGGPAGRRWRRARSAIRRRTRSASPRPPDLSARDRRPPAPAPPS